ncbi:MAG TPA: hypothetical protein VFE33_11110 [Thermoanaerobaculia bacterium]|nr:hypothetical protein [Thermoanaerobaculia bacterium]
MPEPKPIDLLAYLRELGERNDLKVLRDDLVAQGYDPGEVDRAVGLYRIERKAFQRAQTGPSNLGCTLGGFLLGIPFTLLNFWLLVGSVPVEVEKWYLILVLECLIGLALVFVGRSAARANVDGASMLVSSLSGGLIVGSVLPASLMLLIWSICKP